MEATMKYVPAWAQNVLGSGDHKATTDPAYTIVDTSLDQPLVMAAAATDLGATSDGGGVLRLWRGASLAGNALVGLVFVVSGLGNLLRLRLMTAMVTPIFLALLGISMYGAYYSYRHMVLASVPVYILKVVVSLFQFNLSGAFMLALAGGINVGLFYALGKSGSANGNNTAMNIPAENLVI